MSDNAFDTALVIAFAAAVIAIAAMGVHAQSVRNDLIADCEKSLVRNETCILIAVPEKQSD